MRVISTKNIVDFYVANPAAEQPLKAWLDEAKKGSWKTPQDIKNQFSSASFLGSNRVIFNIKGNSFRLVVAMAYSYGAIYVKFIGTHADYDDIDAETVEMK